MFSRLEFSSFHLTAAVSDIPEIPGLVTFSAPKGRRDRAPPDILPLAYDVLENTHGRRYPRVGLPRGMAISWQAMGVYVVSRVGTLGLGGLFIDAANPPALGETIQLFFQVPDGEVRARAIVRDSLPGKGMGVEFTFMASEGRARLHRLLSKLLGALDEHAGLTAG